MRRDQHSGPEKQPRQKPADEQAVAPAQIPGERQGRSGRRWIVGVLLALAALFALNVIVNSAAQPTDAEHRPAASTDQPAAPPAPAKAFAAVQANSAGEIRIPTASIAAAAAQFYEYASPLGERFRFFAVRDSRGTIRTALDHCEVCLDTSKGYTQRSGEMVCGKCGKSSLIDDIGEAAGGCHPIDLPSTAAGNEIIINVADLRQNRAATPVAGSAPAETPQPASITPPAAPAVSAATAAKTFASAQANSAGEIRIPIASLADGTARFYEYASPFGAVIRFFAVRDSRGGLRMALDNCEVCFAARKGYTQRGREMVCGTCGQSAPIDSIGQASGGCHPIDMPSTVTAEDVVIQVNALITAETAVAARASGAGPLGRPRL